MSIPINLNLISSNLLNHVTNVNLDNVNANKIIKNGGYSDEFLMADGSVSKISAADINTSLGLLSSGLSNEITTRTSDNINIITKLNSLSSNMVDNVNSGFWYKQTWVSRPATTDNNRWISVCWAKELGMLVAVAFRGNNLVMTSPDGITWTGRTSSNETNSWSSVCWAKELGLLVAVANYGTNCVMTSPDGITWTARTSSNNSWMSVCWTKELGLFTAVASSGTNRVMTSPDGITWTGRTGSANINGWQSICWSKELGMLASVAISGTNRVMTQ